MNDQKRTYHLRKRSIYYLMRYFQLYVNSIIIATSIFLQSSFALNETLPELDDTFSGILTLEEERELASAWTKQFRSKAPIFFDPPMQEYLEHSANHLVGYSTLKNRNLQLIILPDNQFNAFALAGGLLAVNLGLFIYAQTADQFASVISHEIAHLQQRHLARQAAHNRELKPKMLTGIVSSIVLIALGLPQLGNATAFSTFGLSAQSILSYSREFEEEADREGFRMLYEAGYNPNSASKLFEQLKTNDGEIPVYLRTHPLTKDRIAHFKSLASKKQNKQLINDVHYDLIRMRAVIFSTKRHKEVIADLERQVEQIENIKDKTTLNYGLALAYLNVSDVKNAEKKLAFLLSKAPENIHFQHLNISTLIAAKKYPDALKKVETLLSFYIDSYPLLMLKGTILSDTNKLEATEQVYKKLTQIRPDDPTTWLMLSETLGRLGNTVAYHEAYSEYHFAMGNMEQAIWNISRAKQLSKNNNILFEKLEKKQSEIEKYQKKFMLLMK